MSLLSKGVLNCHIHKVYPIQETAQAHFELESRQTQGKLLLSFL